MTITDALHELDTCWAAAHAAADGLRLTVREDAPVASGHDLPRPVEKAAELSGEIVDLIGAGTAATEEILGGGDPGAARDAVAFLQERRLDIAVRFAKLSAVDRLLGLAELAAAEGGAWVGWWRSAVRGHDELALALHEADVALARCWRELSEQSSVHIATAAVGSLRVGRQTVQRTGEDPCRL